MVPCLVLLLLSSVLPAGAGPGTGQETPCVVTNVTANFPLSLTFHIDAQGPPNVTQAEVRFRVDQSLCAQVESSGFPEVPTGSYVSTQWEWDTRKGGSLPPGAVVRYRWKLVDASGKAYETLEQTYELTDDRYPWQTIAGESLTLLWYRGDQAFAGALMDAAQESLRRLEAFAGVRPIRSVKLFIYDSADDLKGALVFPQEWTGGVAFTDFNIIAIGISPASLSWGRQAIAHELTHVITEQLTFNCFRDIPTWLAEGLATYNENPPGEASATYGRTVEGAAKEGRLLSVRGLGGGFPTAQEQAVLAYAQSFSLIRYLVERYGPEKLGRLLGAFRSGNTADGALQQVYGFDQQGLEAEWRRYIGAAPPKETPSQNVPAPSGPAIPTFEPYTLPTPPPETTPPHGGGAVEPTPTTRGAGGGCSAGLPPPLGPASREWKTAFLPLGPLVLAGLALGIRRRHR